MKTYRPILLVLLFAVAGVLLFIYSSWRDNQRFRTAQHWINHTNEVLRQLDNIQSFITTEESAVRGYTITGNPIFLWEVPEVNKRTMAALDQVSAYVANNPEQAPRLAQLKKTIEEKAVLQKQILAVRNQYPDSSQSLVSSLAGKKLMDQLMSTLTAMKDTENKLLQERIDNNKRVAQQSLNTTIAGAIIVILFIFILLIKLNNDIFLRRKAEKDLQKSESRYRQLVENAGVVNYTADITGRFTFISSQVETITGYIAEELIGRHFTSLIPADWHDRVSGKYEAQFRGRVRESTMTFPIIHKNTELRWVEQDAILLEKDNRVTGFQCVVKDVTEKTLVEQKLRLAEEEVKEYQYRVQAIIDNTPLIIYVKDLEGRYMLINKQFKETFKTTEEFVIGKKLSEFNANGSYDKYFDADRKVIETGKPVELEDVLELESGLHHLLTIKFPLYDKKNEIFGISGFMKDITEMVRYREALIEARQKAESAEMLQEQFLANMSHEIRTPMNGIVGMASLLMQTPLQKQQQEYLQVIRQSSDNLMVLINDILDLSKIKAGKISLEQIPFSIAEIIQPLIATFELKAAEKHVGFSVSLYPDVPQYLTGDPYRLNQVLMNLLSNAFKFTEKGFVTMEISLHQQEEEKVWISIRISDSGIGIKQEQLNYIFESFAQATADTTRKFGGTGLGLAITRRLVELQQGSITVTSESDSGTTFTVIIPYLAADTATIKEIENPVPAANGNFHSYEGKHVLIVEDNEVNQHVLQYSLERYKITTTVVADGSEAVEWLRENRKTDLVMMDLHMSVMDGLMATTCIRRDLHLQVPVVILTAGALKNERKRCIDAGANDYITKPLAQDELQRCLDKFLLHREQENMGLNDQIPGPDQEEHPDFDLSDLLQLQDPESIRIVYDMFEATLPPGLEELKDLAIKKDWEAVYIRAHKLKSSLGIIQVRQLLSKMATIENNARSRKKLKEILPLINEAIETFHEVLPMIRTAIDKNIA